MSFEDEDAHHEEFDRVASAAYEVRAAGQRDPDGSRTCSRFRPGFRRTSPTGLSCIVFAVAELTLSLQKLESPESSESFQQLDNPQNEDQHDHLDCALREKDLDTSELFCRYTAALQQF